MIGKAADRIPCITRKRTKRCIRDKTETHDYFVVSERHQKRSGKEQDTSVKSLETKKKDTAKPATHDQSEEESHTGAGETFDNKQDIR